MDYREVMRYLNRDKIFLMDLYNESDSELEREMIKEHRDTLTETMDIVDELGKIRVKKENAK